MAAGLHYVDNSLDKSSVACRWIQENLDKDSQLKYHFFNTFFFKKLTEKSTVKKNLSGTAGESRLSSRTLTLLITRLTDMLDGGNLPQQMMNLLDSKW